jgi:hypothetical protein
MNRRIDDDQLVELLRRAGTDVELDQARIMSIVNGALPGLEDRPIRRPVAQLQRRAPIQLLALPMVAALAVGLVLVVKGGVPPQSERIGIVAGQTATDQATPAPVPTARLGDSRSITSPPLRPGSQTGPTTGASLSAPSGPVTGSGNISVEVAPVPQGSVYRLPLHGSREWLVVGSSADGSQPRFPPAASGVGPVQVMGSGQSIEVGPYRLSWDSGATGTPTNQSGTWTTALGSVRGAMSGLRLPVRTQHLPAKIVLLAGTVGGSGQVTVRAGADARVDVELPSCLGQICPAVVTITVGADHESSSAGEMMIDLNATGENTKVGLAAVELD